MNNKKLVISTQMPDQFEKLKALMADKLELINAPMIKIEAAEPSVELLSEIENSKTYDWIVFTSMRGIQNYFDLLDKSSITKSDLNQIKFACIGESTSEELQKYGFDANFINPGNTSKEFADALTHDVIKASDKVFIALGDRANDYLPSKLQEYCQTNIQVVYHTIGITKMDWNLVKILDKDAYDLLIFTSPSAFENFIGITGFHPVMKDLKIASIGATTNEQIEKEGYKTSLTASKSNLKTLAEDILNYLGV